MKSTISALLGAGWLAMSLGAVADDKMMSHHDAIKSMDTNSDGKISKDEFTAFHEKMWNHMKKDSNGMVDAKSMMMHHDEMMKHGEAKKDKM